MTEHRTDREYTTGQEYSTGQEYRTGQEAMTGQAYRTGQEGTTEEVTIQSQRAGRENQGLGKWAALAGGVAAAYLGYRAIKNRGGMGAEPIYVKDSVTIDKPQEELYRFWRNFENLPQFMKHLESVQVIDERRSHWKAKAPAGTTVEWDAEIVQEEQPSLIAWRSLEKAQVPNQGQVRFKRAPGNRGTEVTVELTYSPPAGKLGALIAKLFAEEPDRQVHGDLRRFKNLMEAGELPTTEGQPHGERSLMAKVAEAIPQP